MSLVDEMLQKVGMKYEDLNAVERETAFAWEESLNKTEVTVIKVREYIQAMRDAVETELSVSSLGSKQDIFLKARLRNYMLLEALLTSPEKARKAIERSISSMSAK